MEIFDRGYFTEEEKACMDAQDLVYLAVSNYTGRPLDNIYPKNVYEYRLEKDGTIMRSRLVNEHEKTINDVLWDNFINARKPGNPFHVLFHRYTRVETMDDNGFTHKFDPKDFKDVDVQMDFVGRKEPYDFIRPLQSNTLYFLEWVDDKEFLQKLDKFNGGAK